MQALVVDDSLTMRALLGQVLALHGFTVRHAADGPSALDDVETAGPPDLVLVDHNLPSGMDGLQVVAQVADRADCHRTRVMMVSAESAPAAVAQALRAGAHEYLFKPFTVDAVGTKLALLGLGSTDAGADRTDA